MTGRGTISEGTSDGIAGQSKYFVVTLPDGTSKVFNGLLQGGLPFPHLRAEIYLFLHR